MEAIILIIILIIWIHLTKSAMKIGRYLFRRFRPETPARKNGAHFGDLCWRWAGCLFFGQWKRY
ncbi:MAG: hypothetical protein Q3966_03410 [Neisseria sp.]|nr:hypothetical protein [Neisseria sp.]